MGDCARVNRRHDHAISKHRNVGAPFKDFMGGMNNRLLDGISRGLAVRTSNDAKVFYRNLHDAIIKKGLGIDPMPSRIEVLDSMNHRRRRRGHVGNERLDRQGIWNIPLMGANVAR